MLGDGNSAAIIFDSDATVIVDGDGDRLGEISHRLID